MNLFSIAWKSIRQRWLASVLTGLSVALGVMLMVTVLVIYGILDRTFNQRSIGYDLIVGPKGSDMQLVLSTVYRIQPPIENLPYLYYLELQKDPRIEELVPLAFGDVTEKGAFPIVGTTSRFFELPYAPDEEFAIQDLPGTHKLTNPFDAVIGAQVARQNEWTVGSQFKVIHGGAESDHVHDEVFTVVAVLGATGTPNDKTVFIDLEGFYMVAGHEKPIIEAVRRWWDFNGREYTKPELAAEAARLKEELGLHDEEESADGHAHHHHHETPDIQKEVTSVLLIMKRPPNKPRDFPSYYTPMFAAELKEGFKAQAVNPIDPMRRLMEGLVGNVRLVLLVLTCLIVAVSGVGVFVSIYNSMSDRKREIAVMRALGARRTTVFSIILAESVMLCVGGGLLGVLLGHGLVMIAAPMVEARSGLLIDPLAFEVSELYLIPALICLASLVGFIPGLTAYRTDVAKTLAD